MLDSKRAGWIAVGLFVAGIALGAVLGNDGTRKRIQAGLNQKLKRK